MPFVLASASGCLGYDENPLSQELRENEFGYRKRMGEEAALVAASQPRRTDSAPHAPRRPPAP